MAAPVATRSMLGSGRLLAADPRHRTPRVLAGPAVRRLVARSGGRPARRASPIDDGSGLASATARQPSRDPGPSLPTGGPGSGRLALRVTRSSGSAGARSGGSSATSTGGSLPMLSPHDRTALFDALRPPPGFVLDHAVGTSFTLDLEALLTAPIAFALFDGQDTNPTRTGSSRSGSSRRSAATQAGSRCSASRARSQSRPATAPCSPGWRRPFRGPPPAPHRLFHPKIWLARYRQPVGRRACSGCCAPPAT